MFSVFYSECSLLQSTCTTTKWLIVVVLLFQCTSCREENVNFDDFKEIPHIVIAIFIEKPIPFLEEFFARTAGLDYPKDKIDLFIHNAEEYHMNDVEDFIGRFNYSGDLKWFWMVHQPRLFFFNVATSHGRSLFFLGSSTCIVGSRGASQLGGIF